ncbi:MAG: hypothetical protein EB168_09080 [Euryarchaeota archaeon]|nr:hypothetical protein [Euryarchaeota archaeon]
MRRLTFLALVSVLSLSLYLTATALEAPPQVTAPAEPVEAPVWSLVPIAPPLSADMHDSEEWIPQVPALPEGVIYTDIIPTTTTTTTIPLPEWTGSIPEVYGDGSGCTQEEASIIARALWDRGASDETVTKMLRIISRESLCDPSAHNGNRNTRDDSWGLCQQNNLSGWFDEGKLLENYDRFAFAGNFAYNAESCAVMWEECGVGPWNYGNYYCSTPRELR